MKVLTPKEMRAVDDRAINEMGIPGLQLMENAGRSVAEWIMENLPDTDLVIVLAGKGNNGGDGLVAARYLAEDGRDVRVILIRDGKDLSPDCKTNLELLPSVIDITIVDNEKGLKSAIAELHELAAQKSPLTSAIIAIDALLGTGASGVITGLTAGLLDAVRAFNWPVVACDIPSGIDGNDGSYLGAGIPAVATITMGLPKTGLYIGAGVEYCGHVVVADIGFPDEATAPAVPSMETIEGVKIGKLFADDRGRPDEVALHKGDFGRILVVAGSRGMLGANELTSRAALRAGCGLVVAAVPESEYRILASRTGPEIMTAPVLCNAELGCFAPDGVKDLEKYMEWADVLAIGPGFSENPDALNFARKLVKIFPDTPDHQIVVDADGLRAFIDDPSPLRGRHRAPILTPHAGEFARLAKPHKLPDSLLERLIAYAELADSVIVLKGARTLVVSPRETQGRRISVNVETGNAGMATAGSGDVLTGILAGLAGQPTIAWDPYRIACVGVYLHGFAGDLAARKNSRQGMIAGDIIDNLPTAFRQFKKKYGKLPNNKKNGRRR
ncbi:MAG: NAD(P)H-hydrate dehydratase [bacterium]|nr:NAD(P)H-hydrate dehydratase [bacterium]